MQVSMDGASYTVSQVTSQFLRRPNRPVRKRIVRATLR
jgi:hypothetical protein